VSLTQTLARLGGGESAVDTLRDACLAAVSDLTGVRLDTGRSVRGTESFFVERHVLALRQALEGRLDEASARALWALQWSTPPLPGDDDVAYWEVQQASTWLRLAAAALVSCRQAGRAAWVWDVGSEGDTAPLPVVEASGLLVVCGTLGDPELAAVDRWTRRSGCSALVMGRFPPGWGPPPPPVFDPARPERHLVVTGLSIDRARFEVESRRHRFDPFADGDRDALTATAGALSEATSTCGPPGHPAIDWLALAPDGLPDSMVVVHARVGPDALERLRRAGTVVENDGVWRLPVRPPLVPDTRHRIVAEAYLASDPRRLRHLALGGDATHALVAWARDRLDALDPGSVRRLLHSVQSDAVDATIQAAWVEACLADLDLTGARRVLSAMAAPGHTPWAAWLAALDRTGLSVSVEDLEEWAETAPRPAARVGLRALRQAFTRGDGKGQAAVSRALEVATGRLAGPIRAEIEIDRLAILDPDVLADRAVRQELAGDRPELWFRLLHHRAKRLTDLHRWRSARRVLVRLLRAVPADAAGWRGLLELDLGSVALEEGDSRLASDHHLRAYRLLEAAGFRHRLRVVRFNLAVSDVDLLRLESAAGRLEQCGPSAEDPHVAAELVRLSLARGDFEQVATAASSFREMVSSDDPRLVDGLHWIDGVVALLEGNARKARSCFSEAGDHATAWWRLCDTLVRRSPPSGDPTRFDDWGLEAASRMVAAGSIDGVSDRAGGLDGSTSFALALVDRFAPDVHIDGDLRRRAAGALRRIGAVGWAERLRGEGSGDPAVLEPILRMARDGVPGAPDSDEVRALLAALDMTGLEVWDGSGARRLWAWGAGEPTEAVAGGRLRFVPLGGTPRDTTMWRLLVAVAELLHPDVFSTAIEGDAADRGLVGTSRAVCRLRDELRRYAATAVTVLLRGETGVGKEVAARALHDLSGRAGRFVPVNVAAVPESLLEAELFGATKGAFTGADRARTGLAVAADGGTLFLDEIGDLGLGLQVKLLRFLESREVRAVGSSSVRQVDVRIVAATHRDLEARRDAGSFRSDLYFRIAHAPIEVPPLRARLDDLPELLERFQLDGSVRHGLTPCRWAPSVWDALRGHPWPGNVRELRHVVEVAMARCGGGIVTRDDLPFVRADVNPPPQTTWQAAHRDFRRRLIRETLERHEHNRSAAARTLGISRQALLYHMRNLGLGPQDAGGGSKKGAGPEARRRKEEV
jgi:DNA-binding NtrC family response regulator